MKDTERSVRVTVTRNGPYIVAGRVRLSDLTIATDAAGVSEEWVGHERPEGKATVALCRCGHSNSKPFCDGSHAKVGFDGTETANRAPYLERAQAFNGPELALLDVEGLCAFARFCDANGRVWNEVAETGDPELRETFIHQVQNCPSGRLVAWDKARQAALEPHVEPAIGFIEDPSEGCSGPIWLRGGIAVVSADGEQYEVRQRVTLCRCGGSRNKPFCDGTHAAIKFHAK
ncbi:CDGSH iron-sulfur domain-containing protein [Bosea sp. TAB14]|jgi:CDGSH-type Zn-finger protein|uniref:CDGSH iron-sulfur domain-containing protein n=1 Tax=Bosea sp. TAB14 TaxID=3237481 RepID=UPI003F907E86